jgi:EAL domain-containing protein (putative c-di-GMP-specific phosphodiesterase class I)
VVHWVEKSGLPPEFLEIELTEHVLIQENETVKEQLKSLKDMGVKLSIDDFGAGYSNLSYLINFKVDTIKLDKSFISKINTSSDHLVVVKAVIQMAQVLNFRVVAEGVESEAVKQILIDLKCDYAQGYLWSKALPEAQFMEKAAGLGA